MSVRTCIICGKNAKSGEHVFPSALGGRIKNNGIYCNIHNNEYSKLIEIISEQLNIFNALLGVVGDHSKKTTPVSMTDQATGQKILITNEESKFEKPKIFSEKTIGNDTYLNMSFNSQKDADDWIANQRKYGVDVKIEGEAQKVTYHTGIAHKQIKLGGNDEGLRAIAYIAQTFLAHVFPDIARKSEIQGIKDYTLKNKGTNFIWWDFEPANDLPANKFPFGHRIIIGVNKDNGKVYARLSFFSELNFSVIFGITSIDESKTIITDINPLETNPAHSVHKKTENSAKSEVNKPSNITASLSEAISSGKAQNCMNNLMRRIMDYNDQIAVEEIFKQISDVEPKSDLELDELFSKITDQESQKIFNLMTNIVDNFKNIEQSDLKNQIQKKLDCTVAKDPNSASGLTQIATYFLNLSSNAIKKQMIVDYKQGILNQKRIKSLFCSKDGAVIVGKAICEAIILSFPE